MRIGSVFSHAIVLGYLPTSLTYLYFMPARFDHPLQRVVPPDSQLGALWLGSEAFNLNQPLTPPCLPASPTKLTLPASYIRCLRAEDLPAALRILFLPHTYKPRLAVGTLPPSLTHQSLGDKYNQSFQKGLLPDGLQLLAVGEAFRQPFHDIDALPASLYCINLNIELLDRNHRIERRADLVQLRTARLDVAPQVRAELEARCSRAVWNNRGALWTILTSFTFEDRSAVFLWAVPALSGPRQQRSQERSKTLTSHA